MLSLQILKELMREYLSVSIQLMLIIKERCGELFA